MLTSIELVITPNCSLLYLHSSDMSIFLILKKGGKDYIHGYNIYREYKSAGVQFGNNCKVESV